jgi:hypothetical protein
VDAVPDSADVLPEGVSPAVILVEPLPSDRDDAAYRRRLRSVNYELTSHLRVLDMAIQSPELRDTDLHERLRQEPQKVSEHLIARVVPDTHYIELFPRENTHEHVALANAVSKALERVHREIRIQNEAEIRRLLEERRANLGRRLDLIEARLKDLLAKESQTKNGTGGSGRLRDYEEQALRTEMSQLRDKQRNVERQIYQWNFDSETAPRVRVLQSAYRHSG